MRIQDFHLEVTRFDENREALYAVRWTVFVAEQGIDAAVEFDADDAHCQHVLARDDAGQAIGCGRLARDGRIGRLAVLENWRGKGVGGALLRGLIDLARNQGLNQVYVHAQTNVLVWYQKQGFITAGETFIEAGIEHRLMQLKLREPAAPERQQSARDVSIAEQYLADLPAMQTICPPLIAQSRRQIRLYTTDLDYPLFAQAEALEAFKQFALANRNARIHIIVQEPEKLRDQSHPLLDLSQRLSSFFAIRTPSESEDLQYTSAFLLSDDRGFLFRQFSNRYQGYWSPNLPSRQRPLQEYFDQVWQRCRPCSEFRALHL